LSGRILGLGVGLKLPIEALAAYGSESRNISMVRVARSAEKSLIVLTNILLLIPRDYTYLALLADVGRLLSIDVLVLL
jgi:hypothetical protein